MVVYGKTTCINNDVAAD